MIDGRITNMLCHRVVWEAVHGPIPDGLFINHINGVKHDNRIENLELVTASENNAHAYKVGLKSNAGENHAGAKLTERDVLEIRGRAYAGETQVALAREFGLAAGHVKRIVRGKSWAHLPTKKRLARRKLTGEMVAEARRLYAAGVSQPEIGRKFGVSASSISRAVRGTTRSAPK